jgi:hypothetical protein
MAQKSISRGERLEQVRRWVSSGLSGAEFSRTIGVPAGTLAWWRWKFRSEGVSLRPKRARAPGFVEITPPEGGTSRGEPLELEVAGATLRIPTGFDAPTLARVLGVLRSAR